MPTPRKGETKDAWISRCMGDGEERKTFPDQKQRAAVCFNKWKKHLKDSGASLEDIEKFEKEFKERYGIE